MSSVGSTSKQLFDDLLPKMFFNLKIINFHTGSDYSCDQTVLFDIFHS